MLSLYVFSLCELHNALIGVVNIKDDESLADLAILEMIIDLARNSIDVVNTTREKQHAFTSLVYGELSFDLINKVTKQMNKDERSVFLYLGSGIGQLVLQIADTMKIKKCVGIEIRPKLHQTSINLGHAFRKKMSFFNKKHTEFVFFNGDLREPRFQSTIEEATHIITNNIEFDAALNNYIEARLMQCRDGTKVYMSTTLHRRTKLKTKEDSIINVVHFSELKPFCGEVSWRSEPIQLYRYIIDKKKTK